jgi:hypothetical protein
MERLLLLVDRGEEFEDVLGEAVGGELVVGGQAGVGEEVLIPM